MLDEVETEEQSHEEPGLREAFGRILSTERFSDHINAIVDLIYTNELDTVGLKNILIEYKIKNISAIKLELLDLLITYANLILKDLSITDKEHWNMTMLKKFFKIREGDFYCYRLKEIKSLILHQLKVIYNDGNIDHQEALHKVNLQGLFDLSYDQFLQFAEGEIHEALKRGVDIAKLDTVRIPLAYKK